MVRRDQELTHRGIAVACAASVMHIEVRALGVGTALALCVSSRPKSLAGGGGDWLTQEARDPMPLGSAVENSGGSLRRGCAAVAA